jgi:photosystem II stability/assembly factor-like uncharacterized protein
VQIPNLKLVFVLLGLMIIQNCKAQYGLEVKDSNTFTLHKGVVLSKTSFRGLSVVDDNTIWVSGSRGTFARSTDGGKTFTYSQLNGYEKSDFRDIEAFDDQRAVMMSSGTPAYILTTTDGGLTWKAVYTNTDSAYFLDAMDFWDEQRGIIIGDPINGHFVLLETNNGGETWQALDTTKTPQAITGEAVFAASGTSLRCWGKNEFGFVTGGASARRITGNTLFDKYVIQNIGIVHGKSSQGIFSQTKSGTPFLVGGDYLCDSCSNVNAAQLFWPKIKDRNLNISLINNNHNIGYRSCIEALSIQTFIACGTRGVELKTNNNRWIQISTESFHVVRKAKKGNAVFLAGPNGKIGRLLY